MFRSICSVRIGGLVCAVLLAVSSAAFAAGNELTTSVNVKLSNYEYTNYDPNGGEQHATEADIVGLPDTYGMSGQADVRGDVHTSVSVRSIASDANVDYASVRASTDVRSTLAFHVDTPGTINVPIIADGWLTIPDSPLDAGGSFEASGGIWVYIQQLDPQWDTWHIFNGADEIDCRPKKVFSYIYAPSPLITSTFGFEPGETVVGDRSISWSINRVVSATFTEPGDYSVLIRAGSFASAYAKPNIAGTSTYDAYNTVGFGGNFWDVVSGTASFYEIDNPSNRYVPEPASIVLLGLGASVAIIRRRCAAHQP